MKMKRHGGDNATAQMMEEAKRTLHESFPRRCNFTGFRMGPSYQYPPVLPTYRRPPASTPLTHLPLEMAFKNSGITTAGRQVLGTFHPFAYKEALGPSQISMERSQCRWPRKANCVRKKFKADGFRLSNSPNCSVRCQHQVSDSPGQRQRQNATGAYCSVEFITRLHLVDPSRRYLHFNFERVQFKQPADWC